MNISHGNSDGFTLIEVLAAVVIMMVGLLGLLQSINVAIEHDIRNKLRDEAIQIGEEQMSYLRLYSSVTNKHAYVTRTIRGIDKTYNVERELKTNFDGGTKQMSVTVKWGYKNLTAAHYLHTVGR